MEKLKPREVKSPEQGHRASEWQSLIGQEGLWKDLFLWGIHMAANKPGAWPQGTSLPLEPSCTDQLPFSAARRPVAHLATSVNCASQHKQQVRRSQRAEQRAVLPALCPHVFSKEAPTPPNHPDVAVSNNMFKILYLHQGLLNLN